MMMASRVKAAVRIKETRTLMGDCLAWLRENRVRTHSDASDINVIGVVGLAVSRFPAVGVELVI